jgi:hypothetical protein
MQVDLDARASVEEFQEVTPTNLHKEMVEIEDEIHLERNLIHDWEIDVEIGSWVLDVSSSRGIYTKYWNIMDLYWYINTFVGKLL